MHHTHRVFDHISPVWSHIILRVGIQPPGELLYSRSHSATKLQGKKIRFPISEEKQQDADLHLGNTCAVCVLLTLRPVPRCTTGTLSSPVREFTSSLVGSLQRCLLCLGRSTKPCNRPAPDCTAAGEDGEEEGKQLKTYFHPLLSHITVSIWSNTCVVWTCSWCFLSLFNRNRVSSKRFLSDSLHNHNLLILMTSLGS